METDCIISGVPLSGGIPPETPKYQDIKEIHLDKRQKITAELQRSPYDLILYLIRALIHAQLGYPDLAVGDSYKALLLCDECATESFEYHEAAWSTLWTRIVKKQTYPGFSSCQAGLDPMTELIEPLDSLSFEKGRDYDQRSMVLQAVRMATLQCYRNLSISLLRCRCLKSAHDFCSRGLVMAPNDTELLQTRNEILAKAMGDLVDLDEFEISQLPDDGWVRREVYPWNHFEPDRFSAKTLDSINKNLAQIAPKCEVRATDLFSLHRNFATNSAKHENAIPKNRQLGLFARENIRPGETVLSEFSLLAVNNRLKDPLCDACCAEIPPLNAQSGAISCQECDDILFCSMLCSDRAHEEYHPAVCGKDVDTIAKDPKLNEKANALHFLLLSRVFAMALTQKIHPLDLPYVKHIWGDFLASGETGKSSPHGHSRSDPNSARSWSLPFSFKYSVMEPLHVLEKMDVDIFASLMEYDLWIFNTLYAKFRGTASARMNPGTGHPEVAAIHPLWCLANHDCDPNVQWEWGAKMHLWCREKKILDGKSDGIRAGEEILNHYCDINLNVRERREWAQGSLGGWCQCKRCRQEACAEEQVERPNLRSDQLDACDPD